MNSTREPYAWVHRHSLVLGVAVVAACCAAAAAFLPVEYIANDDRAIVTILKGSDGFPADPGGIFINPVTSWLLYALYRVFPSVPFFGLLVYAVTNLAMALIVGLFLRSNWIPAMLSLPVLALFVFTNSVFASFTAATLLMFLAVALCVGELMLGGGPPAGRKPYAALLCSCFFLAFLLRWDLVLIFILAAAPWLLFLDRERLKDLAPAAAVTVVLAGLNYGVILLDRSHHAPFLAYNELRSSFHDTYRGREHEGFTQGALERAGWHFEEYYLFRKNWFVYDDVLFNADTLATFLEHNNPKARAVALLGSMGERIRLSLRDNADQMIIIALCLGSVFLATLPAMVRRTARVNLRAAAAVLPVAALVGGLMAYRFPQRISYPLFLYLYCFAFLLADGPGRAAEQRCGPTMRRVGLAAAFLVMACATAIAAKPVKLTAITLHNAAEKIRANAATLSALAGAGGSSGKIVLPFDPVALSTIEDIHPFRENPAPSGLKIIPYGWVINTPHYARALQVMGVHSGRELLARIIDDDRVVLMQSLRPGDQVGAMEKELLEMFLTFRIRPDRRIRLVPRFQTGDGYGGTIVFYGLQSLPRAG
ncbi:MAG TPA: hypothetical protein PLU54_02910 [Deltaproteobacteria bacterium]|nr:hypothetical protein [Deltaproteobacteria bacterium]